MNIDEFCDRYGADVRQIESVADQWQATEIDSLLSKLEGDVVGNATIVGDALYGDGLRDQIPVDLKDAFLKLMGHKAATYREMRQILSDKIHNSDGGFLSFDDRHVVGFANKLKGQIGENTFVKTVGSAAKLATSGSQEGWDVSIAETDGTHRYVQVKLYASHSAVVSKMREVHDKVANGLIEGCDGQAVTRIDFAVPEEIADRVRGLALKYPELEGIHLYEIPKNAAEAAGIVEEGLAYVGPEQLSHLFDELLHGVVVGASLHALANGFLWYKGSKDFATAFADIAANTSLTTIGFGLGLAAEVMFDATMSASVLGIGGRIFLSRYARARWGFADFLEQSIIQSENQIAALERVAKIGATPA